MKRVIVESMSGYREAVKYIASNESVIWYTTSSEVFSRLSNSDCHVENLEEWITEEYFNSIGIDSYNISNSLTSILEDYYKWDKGYIKQVFGWSIQNLSNVVLYKTVLLDRVVGSSIDSEVLCVGLKSLTPIDNLKLNIERFDTIFSVLAFNINNPKLGIISHNEDKNKLHKLSDYVKHRKMGFYEKTLSILNNTASSFMYKIWRSFYSKTGLFKT